MLDSDLAKLYGVETKTLNRAVKRNIKRFPGDFLMQLISEEVDSLRYQFGTSNAGRGGRRHLPYVFTEHGVVMAASLLNSPQAVEVSVFVVRAFVKLRQLVQTHKEFAGKLDQLERKVSGHDDAIRQLVAAIRQLMAPPDPPSNPMGFHVVRKSAKPIRNLPTRLSLPNGQNAENVATIESRRVVSVQPDIFGGEVGGPVADVGVAEF